ncbi:hypothetical protein B0H11DRAFT_2212038 [Mycena galericulata]|nr:hypothetical protein B0H11DRAFT_2212038 [Mycena galericulata]
MQNSFTFDAAGRVFDVSYEDNKASIHLTRYLASPGKRIATVNLTEENFRSTVKWEGEAIPNETVTEYDDLFRHPSGEVRVSHSDEGSGVTFHDVDSGTLIASSNFYDPTDGISFTDPPNPFTRKQFGAQYRIRGGWNAPVWGSKLQARVQEQALTLRELGKQASNSGSK